MSSPASNPVGWLTDAQWRSMSAKERALQLAAWHCDREKVRESGGNNNGPMVRRFLASVGLDQGYPWCAAFVTYCLKSAGYGALPNRHLGAVRSWAGWADLFGRETKFPERGDLFFWLNPNGSGHIGFVVRKIGPLVQTIEGNTSSGEAGSQRDGDGVYRRVRLASKLRFIRL